MHSLKYQKVLLIPIQYIFSAAKFDLPNKIHFYFYYLLLETISLFERIDLDPRLIVLIYNRYLQLQLQQQQPGQCIFILEHPSFPKKKLHLNLD